MQQSPKTTDTTNDTVAASTADTAAQAKKDLLGAEVSRPWWRRGSLWAGLLLLLAIAAGLFWWNQSRAAKAQPVYVSQEIKNGDLTLTVMANGTLQPTRSVTIGSELSGTVSKVFVDVNEKVRKGQVLVELDTTKLKSQVERSRASLASAQARLAEVQATVREAASSLKRLEEVHQLSGGQVPSATELDAGRASHARALASAQAATAAVSDSRAAVASDETNLSKASIISSIDGVVLTRTVEPGNAVAASLQAVTLFTLAEDLGRLRLDVNVDEADVGSVKEGQKATFTVAAYPSRSYPARVSRVAFGSTTTDNVVTYTSRLDVDNEDQSLRPGMTASATIVSTERKDVLLVPNAALRFTPSLPSADGAKPAAAARPGGNSGIVGQLMPRSPRSGARRNAGGSNDQAGADSQANRVRQVWVEQGGQAVAMTVRTGITDGRMTEVRSEQLQPGMKVIVDQRSAGGA